MTSLLLVLLLAVGSPAPAASPAPAPGAAPPSAPADPDLEQVAAWMAGEFDTFAQVDGDEASKAPYTHLRAVMRIVPVTICGLSEAGRAFYVEQAAAVSEERPYRQRVYLLSRRDGRLVNRIYRIQAPERLVGAWAEPAKLARLSVDQLLPDEGCDLVWTAAGDGRYAGVAGEGRTCRNSLRGATHALSRVEMTPRSITSLDQGFDDAGAHKWGPPPGAQGHVFARRDPLPEAARLAQEFLDLRTDGDGKEVFWYVEGHLYSVRPDGSFEPAYRIAGYNVARRGSAPEGADAPVLTREVFVSVDRETGRIRRDRPPLLNDVRFEIGVRGGRAVAGVDFTSNGRWLAPGVPPAEIRRVVSGGTVRWLVQPFVDVTLGERRYWATESYEFAARDASPVEPSTAVLTWQRDGEVPGLGRVHWLATGRRFGSLDEVARQSALAAELVALVRASHPEFASAPADGPPAR